MIKRILVITAVICLLIIAIFPQFGNERIMEMKNPLYTSTTIGEESITIFAEGIIPLTIHNILLILAIFLLLLTLLLSSMGSFPCG